MLTREIMGWIALAILWVNTLLVAAAALKDLGAIARKTRALGPFRRGRVVRGKGRSGALAGHRVEQVGRAGAEGGGREEIVFHDKSYGGEIYGGAVALEDGGREVTVAPAIDGQVWLSAEEQAAAAACPSEERFAEAYPHARKARGYSRTVEAQIREGATVWLGGEEPSAPRLLSTLDPQAWARSRMLRCAAFALATVVVCAACTAVALWPPVFGTVSKIGALLCLGFFLGVQPLGVTVRESVRSPEVRALRGRWQSGPVPSPDRATAG
ncbi:hypothetical protein [Chondromyces apiculatus]|uniref:Uncharacterized protein n=1 Tax=Chondromyces apiculatus DSM 436 TaxID=1192034 RepID=A0A017SX44_9BACT|nr:hypothetical protein [Chondromyces apiculatus]EYF01524.1 Hypothetical protein CAP_8085 [Chondromyces apiculatus DSM 436]